MRSPIRGARVRLLTLHEGRWGDRQRLPRDWDAQMRAPSRAQADCGLLRWLDTPLG